MPDPVVPPPHLPQSLGAVMPAHARRGDFVPTVNGWLNVTLPGEVVRGLVEKLLNRDIALVRIKSIVINKGGHLVKQGDLVAVQRSQDEMSEIWIPIDERETQERAEREKAERAAAMAPEPVAEPAPAKKRRRKVAA